MVRPLITLIKIEPYTDALTCRQILHDEEMYPDPMSFKPERFLLSDGTINPEVRDPDVAAFGFTRR